MNVWRSIKPRLSRLYGIPLLTAVVLLLLWLVYYIIGFEKFNRDNVIAILTSLIEGMAALLSIAIAVIIFRIQTLENRRHDLEESTLNFIFQISRGSTYPRWTPSVEDDINNGKLTNRYYHFRLADLKLGQIGYNEKVKEYAEDKDTQQARLIDALKLHSSLSQRIQRVREKFIPKMFLLFSPMLLGLFWFMVSDAATTFVNFFMVSVLVLLSAIGITELILIVKDSIAED